MRKPSTDYTEKIHEICGWGLRLISRAFSTSSEYPAQSQEPAWLASAAHLPVSAVYTDPGRSRVGPPARPREWVVSPVRLPELDLSPERLPEWVASPAPPRELVIFLV